MIMLKPYYKDRYCVIYHGDSEVIAQSIDSFDILITDPPYGMKYQSNHRFKKHDKIANDDYFPVEFLIEQINKASRASYVFCRWNNIYEMSTPKSIIAWVKNNWSMGDLKHEHGRQWEACLFYPGKYHEFKKRIPDVIHCNKTKNNLHPTQKPVELIRKIINANEGDVIFDPFIGSGSTLRAAKDLGRKSIGIEIDERYCEIAAKVLSQECITSLLSKK